MEHITITKREEIQVLLFFHFYFVFFLNLLHFRTENSIFPRLTRPFLLPGLLPVANAAKNETTVVSGRRIQMYLPPPPPAIDRSSERAIERNQGNIFEPTVKYHRDARNVDLDPPSPPSRAHKTERSSSPMTFEENVYPSPSSSRLSKPRRQAGNTADGISFTVRYQDRHSPAYRPLSPPTSDMTVPVDPNPDIRIDVDVQAMRRNYPAKRAFLRK
ncbi:hypothetical protein GALMADRAFT_761661 [Galerina marginata CBS 339.88]|uniref:Uncharacterized protein n=1 Tax=Galerina marginata (strain CBS 339.88) TaxID=685588 RepID=A0A067SRM6_GALM3|nr:hypothetical protein GALMADRAFT_761661 [Galerina marginata CBS 339.88]